MVWPPFSIPGSDHSFRASRNNVISRNQFIAALARFTPDLTACHALASCLTNYISLSANIFELFCELLPKPGKGGAALGVKQVARAAAVVIRGAETANRNAELRSLFQEVGPLVFELMVCGAVPDFEKLSDLKKVIDMPVRRGR